MISQYFTHALCLVDCAGRLDREKQTTIVAKSSFCTLPPEIYAGILRRTGCTSKKKEVLFADCLPSEDGIRELAANAASRAYRDGNRSVRISDAMCGYG
jgi:hypothetical protein